ncbi:MAG TPA: efflux RND transporter periplasmic adaptor subunit [Deltaproteobacteria bacterium]|nr:efflux RND transporter periplasmic adaptor subunit [Deltaproteobacteria bacterium]
MHTRQRYGKRGSRESQGLIRRWFMLSLAIGMAVQGCQRAPDTAATPRPMVSGVSLSVIAPMDLEDVFEATGTVRSENTSLVASRVMGMITDIAVREGDTVKAGQLLLRLDDRDARERERAAAMALESARQHRDLAETTWRRYQNLYRQKALSEQEMDQVSAQRKTAQAEYARAQAMAAEARTNLDFTRILAPAAGRVIEKRVDAGSMATPGMPLVVLESLGDHLIETAVDEGLVAKIKPGLPVTVIVDGLSLRLTGSVKEVLPTIDAATRTFIVKIAVRDDRLKSGMHARVRIPLGRRTAILVPENAVVRKGALTGVYVVDDAGVMTYRLIRAGVRSPGGTEVLSGLKAGERVVSGGVERAVDGGMLAKGQGA